MNKEELDRILEKHQVQPVGIGYIDLIVKRDSLRMFVQDIVEGGYPIEYITWWEWCPKREKSKFGMGGPPSVFYDGWFAELAVQSEVVRELNLSNANFAFELIELVESKVLNYPGLKTTYKEAEWLTPALWLDVPDSWKNNSASYTE